MRARIRVSNLPVVLSTIPTAQVVEMKRCLDGGCTDPHHCPQHPGRTPDGEEMVTVEVPGMSGTAFHRALVGLGLVK